MAASNFIWIGPILAVICSMQVSMITAYPASQSQVGRFQDRCGRFELLWDEIESNKVCVEEDSSSIAGRPDVACPDEDRYHHYVDDVVCCPKCKVVGTCTGTNPCETNCLSTCTTATTTAVKAFTTGDVTASANLLSDQSYQPTPDIGVEDSTVTSKSIDEVVKSYATLSTVPTTIKSNTKEDTIEDPVQNEGTEIKYIVIAVIVVVVVFLIFLIFYYRKKGKASSLSHKNTVTNGLSNNSSNDNIEMDNLNENGHRVGVVTCQAEDEDHTTSTVGLLSTEPTHNR